MSPATAERLILDPTEAINNRTAFEITPWVEDTGPDYGTAAIDAVMAERTRGALPVDFTIPNREITIPLNGVSRGGTSWIAARGNFQAKVALFQKEGGVLKRLTNSGGTVYADVVNASFTATSTPGWESAQDIDLEAELSLTVIPDWYEAERQLSDHTETTAAELVFTEVDIAGDYPARVRMVVDDDQAQIQRGLIWGYRSRHYSSAVTASMEYQAEELSAIGAASATSTTNASGGTAVRLSPLYPAWSPLLSTRLGGTADLTHTGSYRAFGRFIVAGTVQTQARLSWDVGDLVNPVVNAPHTFPSPGAGTVPGTAIWVGDLGEMRLDASPVGTHRWQGQVDAQTYNTTSGTADFRMDKLWLVGVDEGFGMLTAPTVAPSLGASLVAFDAFEQTAGTALATQSASLGGNWDPGAAGGSTAEDGDTDDFTTTGSAVTRNPGADSSTTNGRYSVLDGSSTISYVEVQVDISLPTLGSAGNLAGGVLARFVDTDNWVAAWLHTTTFGFAPFKSVVLYKRVAGVLSALGTPWVTSGQWSGSGWTTLKLTIDAAGNYAVYTGGQGAPLGAAKIIGQDTTHLQTAQTLDDGKVGIYDACTVASAGTRSYDNFRVSSPSSTSTFDAVVYASRSAQLTTDGMYRLDTGGTAYGPVSEVVGDLPRLPVEGLEGRTTEVFIKASRGNFADLQDSGIDDTSCRITYSPCWLHVPGT